jgi:hypothetical protein
MPGSVQDLLVEVQAVDVDLVLLPLSSGAHLRKRMQCKRRQWRQTCQMVYFLTQYPDWVNFGGP